MALTLSKLNPSNSLDTTITRKCVSEPISTIRYINHSGIDQQYYYTFRYRVHVTFVYDFNVLRLKKKIQTEVICQCSQLGYTELTLSLSSSLFVIIV